MFDGAKQPKVSKFKPAPAVQQGGMWSKFLTAICPQIPPNMKRRALGRNKPCPCGKVNKNSLEWRLVEIRPGVSELQKVPRPMKFKNCCSPSAIAARKYVARRGNPIISQRVQASLDTLKMAEAVPN